MNGLKMYQDNQIITVKKENKAYWVYLLNEKIAILLIDAARFMKKDQHDLKNNSIQNAQKIIEFG